MKELLKLLDIDKELYGEIIDVIFGKLDEISNDGKKKITISAIINIIKETTEEKCHKISTEKYKLMLALTSFRMGQTIEKYYK